MKKTALILLGLFLAAMAVECIVHLDPVTALVAVGLGLWSWRSFQAARR